MSLRERHEWKEDLPPAASVKAVRRKLGAQQRFRARVLEGTGKRWLVELEDGQLWECAVAGAVELEEESPTLVAVGDFVECVPRQGTGVSGLPQGLIVRREVRRTKLSRYRRREGKEQVVVSNVDQLAILLAAAEPRYDRFLIDRYLIAAEKGELAPLLCINKVDLGDAEQIRADLRFYAEVLGVPVLLLSARTGEGLEGFRTLLAGKATVLSGPSGVGKSTLTNLLVGEEVQRIGEISLKLGQGRHVTTMARMFRLPQGGYIVDTPGIRDLSIWELTRAELAGYFHEFDDWAQECRYQPCSHIHEPECAVRRAVQEGRLDRQRYENYCRLWMSLPEHAYQWRGRVR